ncbi:recombinase family protein [Selenomonas noxia]|uniref:recombinase family protein n=1 Tax=Selenomonas noxia TaxID=135083 RepID=UPI0028E55726|nr:recombinase family protein [Selenomonas noxia]
MNRPKKRAALYIRVSTEEQARHGYSLAEQEHDLRQYAKQHNYTIIGIYADEGISARKTLHLRKGLQRLLRDIKTGSIDIVVFKCLDRWFRNVRDYYIVQDILDAHSVDWECSQESLYNTTTANGRLMLNLKLTLAQHESDQTSDRVKYVQQGLLRSGKVITGHMPDGYKINKRKHIIIDKKKVPMIQDMFKYFSKNQSVLGTYRMLWEKYRYGKTEGAVGRALQNRIYIGEYYGIKNFCPALIDEDLFAKVQKIFEGRTQHPRTDNIYLFSRLLQCPKCGRGLTPRYHRQKTCTRIYYVCRSYTHGNCPYNVYWREDRIETALLASIDTADTGYADMEKAERKIFWESLLDRVIIFRKKLIAVPIGA